MEYEGPAFPVSQLEEKRANVYFHPFTDSQFIIG
jgi:hypothetical protein